MTAIQVFAFIILGFFLVGIVGTIAHKIMCAFDEDYANETKSNSSK